MCMAHAQTGAPSGPVGNTGPALQRPLVRSKGSFELGGVHGMLPYSLELSGQWNAFAKGNIGFTVGGIPLKVVCDLGTDLPYRGQRNSIRFFFDAPKLVDEANWADAKQLHLVQGKLDSLESLKLGQYRKVRGVEAKLTNVQGHGGQPGSARPQVDMPRMDGKGVGDTLDASGFNLQVPQQPELSYGVADSLRFALLRERQQLEQLDQAIGEQRMQVQRLQAVMHARKAEPGIVGKFMQGVKRLELGSCTPASSEFLINGINFQGVSFEYERKGIYLALEKGRSFDDTWLDANPVEGKLRALQQSLFISEARELDARKLTSIKAGIGARNATHFHIGYLKGTRPGTPGTYASPGQWPTLQNHVVEADLGYAIGKAHMLRLALARSVTGANESASAGGATVGDLFGRSQTPDQAGKLEWSSTIAATGTKVSAAFGAIAPYFQSFGMGYIRNGSRMLETRVEQRMGSKLRLKGRYIQERRTFPSERTFDIRRVQLMVSYRPTRAWSIRAGVLPVLVLEHDPGVGSDTKTRNGVYTLGGDYRRRWKRTVAVLGGDIGLYRSQTGMREEIVQNSNVSLSLFNADRWRTSVVWSGLSPWADVGAGSSNLAVDISYRTRKRFEASVGVQWPDRGDAGWIAEVRRPVGGHLTVGLRGQSFARPDIIYLQDVWSDQNNAYNWTLLTTLVW